MNDTGIITAFDPLISATVVAARIADLLEDHPELAALLDLQKAATESFGSHWILHSKHVAGAVPIDFCGATYYGMSDK